MPAFIEKKGEWLTEVIGAYLVGLVSSHDETHV